MSFERLLASVYGTKGHLLSSRGLQLLCSKNYKFSIVTDWDEYKTIGQCLEDQGRDTVSTAKGQRGGLQWWLTPNSKKQELLCAG